MNVILSWVSLLNFVLCIWQLAIHPNRDYFILLEDNQIYSLYLMGMILSASVLQFMLVFIINQDYLLVYTNKDVCFIPGTILFSSIMLLNGLIVSVSCGIVSLYELILNCIIYLMLAFILIDNFNVRKPYKVKLDRRHIYNVITVLLLSLIATSIGILAMYSKLEITPLVFQIIMIVFVLVITIIPAINIELIDIIHIIVTILSLLHFSILIINATLPSV